LSGGEERRRERRGVGRLQAERRAVDDDGVGRGLDRVEAGGLDASVGERRGEVGRLGCITIMQVERGTAVGEAGCGHGAGGAAGAEQDHRTSFGRPAGAFAQGFQESLAVGGVAGPAGRRADERVDGFGAAGFRRKGLGDREGLDLVRYREVDAGEALGVEQGERGGEFFRGDVQAMVAHAGEAWVRGHERRDGGVVHRRAERMGDRVAEYAELARGEVGRA
jgi:hypothetical protein